jgi:hypothetical protein
MMMEVNGGLLVDKKTADLTGPALDWAVDEAQGYGAMFLKFWNMGGDKRWTHCTIMRNYSDNWGIAGPIIEREGIELKRSLVKPFVWAAFAYRSPLSHRSGPTPLIAAMRCYVASKLGDTVDIPEEFGRVEG